jgi:hypothetical protein
MTQTALNIIGLFANILGTVILAFSLNNYIRSIRNAINAHEIYIRSVNDPSLPKIVISGTDQHMNRDKKTSNVVTLIGIILVVAGFVFQLYSNFI